MVDTGHQNVTIDDNRRAKRHGTAEQTFVVLADDLRWQVGIVASEGASILGVAGDLPTVLALVNEHHYSGQGVILALPSNWCIPATFSTEGLPAKGLRRAALFRMEEKLPLPLEEVVVDFVGGGNQTLGVCAALAQLQPMIATLESAGVAVESICPQVLLAMQSRSKAETGDVWLWGEKDRVNIVLFDGTIPTAWYLVPDSPRSVLLHLAAAALGKRKKVSIRASNMNQAILDAIEASPDVTMVISDQEDLALETAKGAKEILNGRRKPWINLRRDKLAIEDTYRQIARPLNFAAITLIICLICACATFLWRAHHYDALAVTEDNQSLALFRQTFVNQAAPAPAHVHRLMESEERALRGVSGNLPAVVEQISALTLIHDVLAALPNDLRYRLSEVRVGDGKLYLEGQTRTHPDADLISESLRARGHFIVPEPRSEQLADGSVSFVINAASQSAGPIQNGGPK